MLFLALCLLMTLYMAYKGVDFFLLAAGGCIVYFYPVLFLERIVFFGGGVNTLEVDHQARLSLLLGILFLLFVGARTKNVVAPMGNVENSGVSWVLRKQAGLVAITVLSLMVLLIAQNGFGLGARDKAELMENLGYAYKLYTLMMAVLISLAFLLKSKVLLSIAVLAVTLDMMFGFRGGAAIFIASYFLTRSTTKGWRNVFYVFLGVLGALLMIVAKETAYFSKDLVDVAINFSQSLDSDGLDYLSLVNPESATTSAVYNEMIRKDFHVSPIYLFDSLVALFPFTNVIGYETTGFATYFKGVLFGAEGDSFASGMLAVGYGIGNYVGVAVCFIAISYVGRVFNRINARGTLLDRSLVVAISAVVLTSFYRSDLLYLTGIFRSIIVLVVMLKLCGMAMSVLSSKPSIPLQQESLGN